MAKQENRKTHQQKERAQRQKMALQLRLGGASYPEIGEKLGHSQSTVYNDVQKALRDIPRTEADQLRTEELARLDRLQRAVWAQALEGKVTYVDRALKIIDRRARLLGLDAPSQVEVSTGADLDLDGAVRALVEAAQQGGQKPDLDSLLDDQDTPVKGQEGDSQDE